MHECARQNREMTVGRRLPLVASRRPRSARCGCCSAERGCRWPQRRSDPCRRAWGADRFCLQPTSTTRRDAQAPVPALPSDVAFGLERDAHRRGRRARRECGGSSRTPRRGPTSSCVAVAGFRSRSVCRPSDAGTAPRQLLSPAASPACPARGWRVFNGAAITDGRGSEDRKAG